MCHLTTPLPLRISLPRLFYIIDSCYNSVFVVLGAGLLVNDYGGSLFGLLNDVYSTHIWRPWLFDTCPQNYWESMSNQREYFDWLAEQFGVASLDDWYTIRPSAIRTSHAVSLLSRYYENSISKALFAIYPSHPWESSKFNVTLQEPSP
jgi:hypothetical protein